MSLPRRNFLLFLGSTIAAYPLQSCMNSGSNTPTETRFSGFKPLQPPIPCSTNGVPIAQQVIQLANYEIKDDLVLPEGHEYQVLAAWGDRLGNSRVGYNNDYLAFVETGPNEGVLTINFEYISAKAWLQNYRAVIGKDLPIEAIEAKLKQAKKGIDAFALADNNDLKKQIAQVCKEALIDQGLGMISIRRTENGQWERTYSKTLDRRISGIAGLDDGKYLNCTGPAKTVFAKTKGQGYIDRLGTNIMGTFGNCAGGITPWGTVLSAEENIQAQVPEAVYADGSSFPPSAQTVAIDAEEVSGQGNVFGLAGNKYGWIVEVDPTNPQDTGTKHTWLGRYRHEAVGVRAEVNKPIAFYSGCDRRGGHIYKFVSTDKVRDLKDKKNSNLLKSGMLYAAQFNPDGTGRWIALKPDTPVSPGLPSQLVGGMINLPDRPKGGYKAYKEDAEIANYRQQYKTLNDLYSGSAIEKQGAILIDAHYAANAAGATCTARPEDTEIAADGSLYIAFTSGSPSSSDGSPDRRIFKGPKGETPYEYGFIMHLIETGNDPNALTFKWEMLALGGDPAIGGAGFANPDNLMIDRAQNVWMVCDMSSSRMNQPMSEKDKIADRRGLLGNNNLWCIPTTGESAGKAYLFAMGPMECELTGPFLSSDERSLFLSVQHPGEANGTRQDLNSETRRFELTDDRGNAFTQTRQVPLGSNFPDLKPNSPTKPAIVVVKRKDNQPIRGTST